MTRILGQILALSLFSLCNLTAQDVTGGAEAPVGRIKVRMVNRAHIDNEVLSRAKAVAVGIYERVGVEMAWLDCAPEPTAENANCEHPQGPNDMAIRICSRAQDVFPKKGYLWGGVTVPLIPDGASGIIILLYDHLEKAARYENVPLELVLGITMAHEIGHLLISPDHSMVGIMRVKLGKADWKLAIHGQLQFYRDEGEAIRRGVERRTEAHQVEQLHQMAAPGNQKVGVSDGVAPPARDGVAATCEPGTLEKAG